MHATRRTFLRTSTAAAALGLSGLAHASLRRGEDAVQPAEQPLRILILGGTGYLGPHFVRRATARGHTVTLFNRGRTNPHLFPELEKLVGDRDGDLEALRGHTWDAVVDTSGYVPRIVGLSAELAHELGVRQYLFVSTISVYRDFPGEDIDEQSAVATIEDESVETVDNRTYGALKALCEQTVEKTFGEGATVVRPGLISGPGDPTDRFTYWPVRVSRGGEILAPDNPDHTVSFIDVRDLAAFMVHLLEQRTPGTFNADGPAAPVPMGELLAACGRAAGIEPELTWVPTDFLAQEGVHPWAHMPMWIPPPEGAERCPFVSRQRAIDAGLTFRPPVDTARDTLEWWGAQPERPLRAGLPAARETEVLAAWHAQTSRGPGAVPDPEETPEEGSGS